VFCEAGGEKIRQNGWAVGGISGIRSADDVKVFKGCPRRGFHPGKRIREQPQSTL